MYEHGILKYPDRLRGCVAILFCHYETPLRRRGNLEKVYYVRNYFRKTG